MKQTLWPLISEIKRWELGFRVKYGQSVETIYLCGGSSRINNIANFLSQAIGVRVELLDYSTWVQGSDDSFEDSSLSMSSVNMMGISQLDKEIIPNFLSGAFANTMSGQLPLYSISFLAVRTAAICLLLITFMMVERFVFLERENKLVDAEVIRSLKTPTLGIPVTERRYYPSQPKRILAALKKKNLEMSQEVSLVQSAIKEKAIAPLVEVSQALAQAGTTKVAYFEAENGNARLVLTSDNNDDLMKAQAALSSANLTDYASGPGNSSKEVTITFKY